VTDVRTVVLQNKPEFDSIIVSEKKISADAIHAKHDRYDPLVPTRALSAYIDSNAAGGSRQLERLLKNVAATGFKMP
jgi:hypothetical protein